MYNTAVHSAILETLVVGGFESLLVSPTLVLTREIYG
jgi:hypothetical protein